MRAVERWGGGRDVNEAASHEAEAGTHEAEAEAWTHEAEAEATTHEAEATTHEAGRGQARRPGGRPRPAEANRGRGQKLGPGQNQK